MLRRAPLNIYAETRSQVHVSLCSASAKWQSCDSPCVFNDFHVIRPRFPESVSSRFHPTYLLCCLTMAGAAAIGALKVLPCCFEIMEKIIDVISVAKDNNDRCSHIVGQVETIKGILHDLERTTLSNAVMKAIDFVHMKLISCENFINEMFDRKFSRPPDFLQGRGNRRTLIRLMNEVDSAVGTLNAALSTQALNQQQEVQYSSGYVYQPGSLPGRPRNLTIPK